MGTMRVLAAEQQLGRPQDELEVRLAQRTSQYTQSYKALQTEIANRKKAEASLRELSGRLLQLQDEERRRIARELHDSTSQKLVATAMNIAVLQRGGGSLNDRAASLLEECAQLVEECSTEIRTISYLLHPPALDELGLGPALRWAAMGFGKRSGIQVHLDIPEDMDRFPHDVELAIFRVVQEALTNIHRHSRSRTATITARHDAEGLTVTIADQGCGVPEKMLHSVANASLGVGIAGMRERMRQLGGFLEITSGSRGTQICAHVPHAECAAAAA